MHRDIHVFSLKFIVSFDYINLVNDFVLQAVEEKIHGDRDHRTDAPHYACRCWK